MSLAVIFDMDGLMLDTERIAWDAWREASRRIGCPLSDHVYDEMHGLNVEACKEILSFRLGPAFPVDALEQCASEIYVDSLKMGIPLKPGLLELIHFLEDRGIPKAVATSSGSEQALHKLQEAGVLKYFDIVVGGDQVSKGKPNPDIYLLAAARIKHRPEECIALEDSDPGIRAASAAGMRTILIPDLVQATSAGLAAAWLIVSSLHAVIPVVEELLSREDQTPRSSQ